MDMVIPDAFKSEDTLANAKVHRVLVMMDNTLLFESSHIEGKDYKLIQMSPDMVMLGENTGGELVFEDALEVHYHGQDAKTLEALRKHRLEHGKLVTLMSPLPMRNPLPIPAGAHKAFWAYTL